MVLMVGAEDFRRLTEALPPLQAYFDRYVSEAFPAHPGDNGQRCSVVASWNSRVPNRADEDPVSVAGAP